MESARRKEKSPSFLQKKNLKPSYNKEGAIRKTKADTSGCKGKKSEKY